MLLKSPPDVPLKLEEHPLHHFLPGSSAMKIFRDPLHSVAYIGYAGTLELKGLEVPIAICLDSIFKDGKFTCNTGRMINSSGSTTTNTAAWSNLEQVDAPCKDATEKPPTATPPTVRPLVCGWEQYRTQLWARNGHHRWNDK